GTEGAAAEGSAAAPSKTEAPAKTEERDAGPAAVEAEPEPAAKAGPAAPEAQPAQAPVSTEEPAPAAGRIERLRGRLAKSRSAFGQSLLRSEERRVGKECRCRWARRQAERKR